MPAHYKRHAENEDVAAVKSLARERKENYEGANDIRTQELRR